MADYNSIVIGSEYEIQELTLNSGDTARFSEVFSGGTLVVRSGASAVSTTVDGGILRLDGGTLSGWTEIRKGEVYFSGSTITVGACEFSNGTTLHIASGTVLNAPSITVSGTLLLENNVSLKSISLGETSSVVLSTFAADVSFRYGVEATLPQAKVTTNGTAHTADNFILKNKSVLTVEAGDLANYTTLSSGGTLFLKTNANASGVTLNSGGILKMDDGATASGVNQKAGGVLILSTATTVSGTNASGSYSVQDGIAANLILESGAALTVKNTHQARNTLVNSGGILKMEDGSAASGVNQGSGGILILSTDAIVSGNNVSGNFSVEHGVASNLILESGAALTVKNTHHAMDTIVNSGGQLVLESGASASGVVQNEGAVLNFRTDATASGNYVDRNGNQTSFAISDGIATDLILELDSVLTVVENTSANSIQVRSGGLLSVSGGRVTVSEVFSGGKLTVVSGTASGVTVKNGGLLSVVGGTASGSVLESGAVLEIEGGIGENTALASGATENVSGSQAKSTGSRIDSGAVQNLSDSALSESAFVAGEQNLRTGANAKDSLLNKGTQNVYETTTADDTAFGNQGGTQNVYGAANGTLLTENAVQYVYDGGLATGSIASGGRIVVESGGRLESPELKNGGSLELKNGSAVTNVVQNGGALILTTDSTTSVSGTHSLNSSFSFDGLTAESFLLENGGVLTVASGYFASNTHVGKNGTLVLRSGSTLSGETVLSGGTVEFSDNVTVTENASLAIQLMNDSGNSVPFVQSLNSVANSSLFITIDVDPLVSGRWLLASGAASYPGSFTVRTDNETLLTDFRVGEQREINSVYYKLTSSAGGGLYVSVSSDASSVLAESTELAVNSSHRETLADIRVSDVLDVSDCYKFSLEKASNCTLTITGDFNFSALRATLLDASGRTIAALVSKTVNGITTLSLDRDLAVLPDGQYYYVRVESTDKKTPGAYEIEINTIPYAKGDNADDSLDLVAVSPTYTVELEKRDSNESLKTEKQLFRLSDDSPEWIGFGDTVDYRKVVLNDPGSYRILLSQLAVGAKATLTIYDASGKALGKAYTFSSDRSDDGFNALLDAGTYYFKVSSVSSVQTDYNVSFGADSEIYGKADTSDDSWRSPHVYDLNSGSGENWVGFGDVIDYYKFTIDSFGVGDYTFSLTCDAGCAGFALYYQRFDSNLVENDPLAFAGKNVVAKDGQVQLSQFLLAGTYYFAVYSANDRFAVPQKTDYTVVTEDFKSSNYGNISYETAEIIDLEKTSYKIHTLELTESGRYSFDFSILSAPVFLTVYGNVNGVLKALTATVLLNDSNPSLFNVLLSEGVYYVKLENRMNTSQKYTLTVKGEQYTRTDLSNNEYRVIDTDSSYYFQVTKANDSNLHLDLAGNDEKLWVGFGDPVDYRRIDIACFGTYSITVSNLQNRSKVTLYQEITDAAGKTYLRAMSSITVTPAYDKWGNWVNTIVIRDQLLSDGSTYYVAVEALDSPKGQNTSYQIHLDAVLNNSPDSRQTDNDWRTLENGDHISLTSGNTETYTDWVGLGDTIDYRELNLEDSSLYRIRLTGVENPLKFTLWEINGNQLRAVRTVTVAPSYDAYGNWVTSALLGDFNLDASSGKYYLSVESVNASQNKNSSYSVQIESLESRSRMLSNFAISAPICAVEPESTSYEWLGASGNGNDYTFFTGDEFENGGIIRVSGDGSISLQVVLGQMSGNDFVSLCEIGEVSDSSIILEYDGFESFSNYVLKIVSPESSIAPDRNVYCLEILNSLQTEQLKLSLSSSDVFSDDPSDFQKGFLV